LAERFRKVDSVSMADLLRQPGFGLADLLPLIAAFDGRFSSDPVILERAAIQIRYQGYVDKQDREIARFKKLESEQIPELFSYDRIAGMRNEAREKFSQFRPASLGQAGRIEGITPGDLAVLSVHLKRFKAAESGGEARHD